MGCCVMAAAYGALVSVMQIMDQLHHHPHPPISLHKEHAESLAANVTFLQEFLEGYNPHVSYTSEADPLESRIAEAAYEAEDVIENYIVNQIQTRSIDHDGGKISSTQFYQGLEKVIQEMDLIKMEVVEKKMEGVQIIKRQSTTDDAANSSRSSSIAHKVTTTIGLDEVLNEMLEKIARGVRARQIIPIVGMGGLGKTTLAQNIYENQLVKEHFDICAWSTISQVHNARKILKEILGQVGLDNDGGDLSDGHELGLKLYQHLIGKRYLIVMDDMWNIEAWDKVRNFFPENENGSRVVVTTRLSNLAYMFNYSDGLDMKFMDEATCWELFSKTLFGDKSACPPELEDVGKKIVEGCKGLPLSIVVVGGLLSKTEATPENWKFIEERLSWVVNSEADGSCLQTLYVSYNNLPIHIKPCFLYFGLFSEDEEIAVVMLIAQWAAEGFVKPIDGKSLEEAAQEYLEELVDRNLVIIERHDGCGNVGSIKMHDLLRDLALREGEKDKFVWSSDDRKNSQGMIRGQRRITNAPKDESLVEAAATVRSLTGKFGVQVLPISRFRLLRVHVEEKNKFDNDEYCEEILIRLLNLRFLVVDADERQLPKIPSYLWNFQMLFLMNADKDYVVEIWKMPLLKLVAIRNPALCLSDPPPDEEVIVLENLHTLFGVRNLKLSEEVLKRIPNIESLKLSYKEKDEEGSESSSSSEEEEDEEKKEEKGNYYCLNNLHRLNKLQYLDLSIRNGWDTAPVQELSLPHSLVQLTLGGAKLPWEEMASKIGCLPLLQVLVLKEDSFVGWEWVTVEGQFSSLEVLEIEDCGDLEQWITDDYTHFPRLEQLVLYRLTSLREIPSCIGDIPTLRLIQVARCSDSAMESARIIQEEQEEYDNQLLQIRINEW